ncbi:hypothetical protein HYH02_010071 [Chlamydomonas schloesseri]|uniref:TMEM205-like domain-containing protein n=1 Tax=Chlamydomonas schloesseri TaxID=2026947 RepID=A0A835TDE6_9CHLO|nr:hypothetical protein HYH02_010071 [Chlamydomonas schloesseri]|eukprot:KAG2441228.1 hypothetical protein HYH02_010071 [Chlamydomonas schloesseri]
MIARSALPARGAAAATRRVLPTLPRRSPAAPLRLQPLRSASEATSTAGLNGSSSSNNGNGAAAEHANAAAAAATTATATAAAAAPAGAAATAVNEDFKGDMLKPSVVNTPLVRAAAVLGAVGLVAGSTALLPGAVGAFLHVTAYGILLGAQLWNTFFVGITMFKNLPRQTFGKVQSKLFPQYFALTAGSNLLALATLWLAGAGTTPAGTRALVALGVSLVGLLANWLYLEPICTDLMFQRYDIENLPEKTDADKDKIAALYKQFGKWHGISSLVNLVSFCVVVAHGWYLASLLTL